MCATCASGWADTGWRPFSAATDQETYLFRAACSELRQEIKNNRRLQDEQIRQQRAHLQHEVDILTQSLNQAVLTLNDNVRGMFNDRRMAVREEQKTADSAVRIPSSPPNLHRLSREPLRPSVSNPPSLSEVRARPLRR